MTFLLLARKCICSTSQELELGGKLSSCLNKQSQADKLYQVRQSNHKTHRSGYQRWYADKVPFLVVEPKDSDRITPLLAST